VGYWTFDGKDTPWTSSSAATTLDKSGNGNTGTLTNMNQSTSPAVGKIGQGLYFDGVNDSVTANSAASAIATGDVSYSAWFKLSGAASGYIIDLADAPSNNDVYLYFDTGTPGALCFQVYNTGFNCADSSQTIWPTGVWHHAVGVFSGVSGQKLYVDGVLVGTNANTSRGSTAATQITLGSEFDGALQFNGTIDDVRIYNRALSASEVQNLYNSGTAKVGVSPNGSSNLSNGLVTYWTFDGKDTPWTSSSAATTLDKSGNGNAGTLTNMGQSTAPAVGKIGQALQFNGTNNYVQSANTLGISGAATRTIAFWAKAAGSDGMMVSMGTAGTNQMFGAMILGSHWYLNGFGGGNDYDTGVVADTKWHFHTITYDGTTANWYLDTNKIGAGFTHAFATVDSRLLVGLRIDALYYFPGTVDDVRIYNRALSASEIQQLYQQGVAKTNVSPKSLLTTGLIGNWTFDGPDITTAFLDKSGNGFSGYLVGTNNATSSRTVIGKIGQAFSFGGLNTGGISVGNSSSLDPNRFTIAGWVYTPVASSYTYDYIFSNARDCCGTYNGIELLVGYNGAGVLTGTIWNSTAFAINSSGGAVPDSKWTHVAFTYDGSNMRLYVNGVQNNSVAQTTDPGTPASFGTYIASMGAASGATYTFNGNLDDLRLYSRALSASEILQLYNAGK
jgi:hypothetical protein